MAFQLVLFAGVKRSGKGRSFHTILRPQHYVQATVQASVFAYWGYYWRPVYEFLPLLLAQLVFAYAFDMLLAWSRRESYVLGFGPFPILFSTNLFLWFRDEWFYLQFLMVAAGFLGKEFVRWHRDGKWTHVFNPSAFSLGLFSLALISTGSSDLTWGQEIASTLSLAPRIYLFLFLFFSIFADVWLEVHLYFLVAFTIVMSRWAEEAELRGRGLPGLVAGTPGARRAAARALYRRGA